MRAFLYIRVCAAFDFCLQKLQWRNYAQPCPIALQHSIFFSPCAMLSAGSAGGWQDILEVIHAPSSLIFYLRSLVECNPFLSLSKRMLQSLAVAYCGQSWRSPSAAESTCRGCDSNCVQRDWEWHILYLWQQSIRQQQRRSGQAGAGGSALWAAQQHWSGTDHTWAIQRAGSCHPAGSWSNTPSLSTDWSAIACLRMSDLWTHLSGWQVTSADKNVLM